MPAPEWLLSHFITTRSVGSVGASLLQMWLLGLKLWHVLNSAPWHGMAHLAHTSQGSRRTMPVQSFLPKCAPVTLAHLQVLHSSVNLNDTFDAALFAIATIAFWCQCHISEVCVDHSFNTSLNAHHDTPQKSGYMASNIMFHAFWAPQTKTKPWGEFIMWTDSGCNCSTQWAFTNHLKVNSHVPLSAHLLASSQRTGLSSQRRGTGSSQDAMRFGSLITCLH